MLSVVVSLFFFLLLLSFIIVQIAATIFFPRKAHWSMLLFFCIWAYTPIHTLIWIYAHSAIISRMWLYTLVFLHFFLFVFCVAVNVHIVYCCFLFRVRRSLRNSDFWYGLSGCGVYVIWLRYSLLFARLHLLIDWQHKQTQHTPTVYADKYSFDNDFILFVLKGVAS